MTIQRALARCRPARAARRGLAVEDDRSLVRGGLILLLIFTVASAQELATRSTNAGPVLMLSIAWSNWALVTLLAIGLFSSVITEEKELMSLGLLRMAGFTPVSLLLGKSIGLLLQTVLMIVIQVPFCMLAITLGGVTVGEIFNIFGLILSYTVFVYGLALLCSVIPGAQHRRVGHDRGAARPLPGAAAARLSAGTRVERRPRPAEPDGPGASAGSSCTSGSAPPRSAA